MFQDEIGARAYMCPSCGTKLVQERDLFRCEEHGSFFVYGPRLLVRVPRQSIRLPNRLHLWENYDVGCLTGS